jgi:phage FluMu protein gp41
MSKETAKPKFVQPERNADGRLVARGTFIRGLKIGERMYTSFEMQEAIMGDLIDAEKEASIDNPLGYSAALIARQLVRTGDYEGPFKPGMLRTLRAADFNLLRKAQMELDELGEVT